MESEMNPCPRCRELQAENLILKCALERIANIKQFAARDWDSIGVDLLIQLDMIIYHSKQALTSTSETEKIARRIECLEDVAKKARKIGYSYVTQSTYGFDDLSDYLARLDGLEKE